MLSWPIWALTPTKYYENKTVWVVFQGASDGNARIRRNIAPKLKNSEKLESIKINFFKWPADRSEPTDRPIDRSTDPTDRPIRKKSGGAGGVLPPPAKNMFLYFFIFIEFL